MAGLMIYPQSDLEIGMGVARAPESMAQASGLNSLGPTTADVEVMRQAQLAKMSDVAKQAYSGVSAPAAGLATTPPPPQEPTYMYNPQTNQMFANGQVFAADDYQTAVNVARSPDTGAPPPPNFGGQKLSPRGFTQYMEGISANRGIGGNLWQGFQTAVGGLVGGTGKVLETTGIAPETGKAISGFSEKYIEPSQNEQFRSAMIANRQSGVQNFFDAVVQAVPSLATSLAGGVGGAALAGRGAMTALKAATAAGGTAETIAAATAALNQSRTIGSLSGLVATTFPGEVQSLYESAQKAKNPDGTPAYNLADPATRAELLAAAAGSTAIQLWADHGLAKGMSLAFNKELRDVAAKATTKASTSGVSAWGNAGKSAAMGAFSEAFAEGTAELIQKATFDPEFRSKLNVNDMKMLAPYILDKYGKDIAFAAGVGGFLGGVVGGATNFRSTDAVDLNKAVGERAQAEAKAIADAKHNKLLPQLGVRVQGELFPDMLGIKRKDGPELGPEPQTVAPDMSDQMELPLSNLIPIRTVPPLPPSMPPDFTGLPMFEGAPRQGELFPGGVQQSAPDRYYEPQQLNLPLEGPQLELPLAPPAPIVEATPPAPTMVTPAPSMPSADTPLGAALLKAQEAKRAQAEAKTKAERNKLQKRVDQALAQVEAQLSEDAQAQADIIPQGTLAATGIPEVGPAPAITPQQLALFAKGERGKTVGKERSARAEALRNKVRGESTQGLLPVQTEEQFASQQAMAGRERLRNAQSAALAPETYGPSGQMELFTQKGTPAAAVVKANEAALKKTTLKKTTPKATGQVTPPKPEGVASAAPANPPSPSQTPSEGKPTGAGGSIANPNVASTGRTTSLTEGAKRLAEMHNRRIAQTETNQTEAPSTIEVPIETSFGSSTITGETEAVISKFEKALALAQNNLNNLQEMVGSLDPEVYSKRAVKLEANIKVAQDGLDIARAIAKGKVVGRTTPGTGKFSLADWNTTNGAVDAVTGNPIAQPLVSGRVRMIVSSFVSKLAMKPTVTIAKNQADLKAINPKLYAAAKAARGADFDTAQAAGYSFGNGQVIIFSDRVASEQHLRFVLAHETLGHFGLRGIMPAYRFDALMEALYDENPNIKGAVDAAMSARGMSKAEATEEYLSDYAGMLETRLIYKIWNAVKGFLNKLGVRFGDEAMRYFLDQSRRYVRTGQTSASFDADEIALRLQAVETGGDTGRFSIQSMKTDSQKAASNLWIMSESKSYNIGQGIKDFLDMKLNLRNNWDNFKANWLSLNNYRANSNPGLYAMNALLDGVKTKDSAVVKRYDEMLASLYAAPEADQNAISQLLYKARDASIEKLRNNSESLTKDPLFTLDGEGKLVPNTAAIKALEAQGTLTLEQAKALVPTIDEARYAKYLLARKALAGVEVELLQAKYANAIQNETISRKTIKRLMSDGKLNDGDNKFIGTFLKRYKEIYTTNLTIDASGSMVSDEAYIKRGNDFAAKVNAAFIGKDVDRNAALVEFFNDQKQADDFIALLEDSKKRRKPADELSNKGLSFLLQNETKHIIMTNAAVERDAQSTKRQLATGYIPIVRTGGNEVRMQAYVNGQPVKLSEEHQAMLIYSQFDSPSEARDATKQLNDFFADNSYDAMVRNADGEYVSQKVKLVARYGDALETAASDPKLNLDEFLYGLRLFGMNVSPSTMAEIMTTLTTTSDRARKRLQYSGTPGYDPNSGIFAMSSHIKGRASAIAKTLFRPDMRELMDRTGDLNKLWVGNVDNVVALKKKFDGETNEKVKTNLKRELDHALYMYTETYPDTKGWDGSADTQPTEDKLGQELVNRYYNEAARTLDMLDGNRSTTESDFEAGKLVSSIRAFTSIVQLGGNFAIGFMNMASPYTNWAPYMSYYNPKNGFGGGFGYGTAMGEYHRALASIGAPGLAPTKLGAEMNTAEFYDKVAEDPALLRKYGLEDHEAQFIARETREGKLMPAQSNALLGMAMGHYNSPWMRKFVDVYMSPFNRTEQATRRAAGLAAYRLEYKRQMGATTSTDPAVVREAKIKAQEIARDFAVKSLDLSLGEYSVLNRPPGWRQGIQSFLYMYKVYPTTTIQLLSNMNRAGKLTMLGTLYAFSGIAGLPFAEDLEDIIDTIAPRIGFTKGSIRAEIIKHIEEMAPGMSPYILKGAITTFLGLPADVASRIGMGDVLPGTAMFIAGAKIDQEAKGLLGPSAGAMIGVAQTAKDILLMGTKTGKTVEDIGRESPVSLIRNVSDVMAFMSSGAIVDRRGYVVSPEMHAGIVIARLMGFYPKAAADEHEIIKYSNRIRDFQKEVSFGFRTAAVKATLRGDTEGLAQIRETVREWNDVNRGTSIEIPNFERGVKRAVKEAQRPASQRALMGASKGAKGDIQMMMDALLEDD